MFAVELLGFIAVVITVIVAVLNNRDTGRETGNAIASMSKIANAMSNEQSAVVDQAHATADLARAAGLQAKALQDMASATRQSAESSKIATEIAERQMRQSLTLFTTQQRPIVTIDLTQKENAIQRFPPLPSYPGGLIAWRYSFKNVGLSAAFKVTNYESLSLNSGKPQTAQRHGAKLMPPRLCAVCWRSLWTYTRRTHLG